MTRKVNQTITRLVATANQSGNIGTSGGAKVRVPAAQCADERNGRYRFSSGEIELQERLSAQQEELEGRIHHIESHPKISTKRPKTPVIMIVQIYCGPGTAKVEIAPSLLKISQTL